MTSWTASALWVRQFNTPGRKSHRAGGCRVLPSTTCQIHFTLHQSFVCVCVCVKHRQQHKCAFLMNKKRQVGAWVRWAFLVEILFIPCCEQCSPTDDLMMDYSSIPPVIWDLYVDICCAKKRLDRLPRQEQGFPSKNPSLCFRLTFQYVIHCGQVNHGTIYLDWCVAA